MIGGNEYILASTPIVQSQLPSQTKITFSPTSSEVKVKFKYGTSAWTWHGHSICITKPVMVSETYYVDVCDGGEDKYRFRYSNHEKLNEVSGIGNTIDMGDRWLDTRLGRTPKPDAKAGKYPFISPYAYALNNPIIYNDPDGKDVYLVIYTTKEGDVGHAAIAVENYKQVTTKVMENGKEVTKTEWVKDGTLTFYELGPQNGIDGKTGALKDVEALYGKQTVTKDQVFNEALSVYESTAPDGIIKFTTDATTDLSIHKKLGETYQKDKPDYNATSNNCSDYAGCGASEAAGKSIDGKERLFLWIYSTTPNKLFREAAKAGNATIEKDPGQQVNKSFEDAYEGTSSSDDSKKTK